MVQQVRPGGQTADLVATKPASETFRIFCHGGIIELVFLFGILYNLLADVSIFLIISIVGFL